MTNVLVVISPLDTEEEITKMIKGLKNISGNSVTISILTQALLTPRFEAQIEVSKKITELKIDKVIIFSRLIACKIAPTLLDPKVNPNVYPYYRNCYIDYDIDLCGKVVNIIPCESFMYYFNKREDNFIFTYLKGLFNQFA